MIDNFHNEGIYQTGGTINAEQLAVGRNASVIKTVNAASQALEQKGLQEVQEKLQIFMDTLSAHLDRLDNREEILESAETVAKELTKKKPNKLTVTAVLDGITSGVKSVTNLATASELLKQAVLSWL